MDPIRSRMDARSAVDKDAGEEPAPAPAPARGRQRDGASAQPSWRVGNTEPRADVIGRAAPFSGWPREVLLRLAKASCASCHAAGTALIVKGERCDHITVIADGTVLSSVSTPGGRRLTYKIDRAAFAYGLAALADGLPLQIDLIADGSVTVIRIPIATVRAELSRMPALWESIAVETIRRSRRYARQLNQLVLDTPRVRAATLLTGLLAKSSTVGADEEVAIDFRLSQERLAELLGVSRQWATAVVRELVQAGVIEWRYGRVKILDVPALHRLTAQGVEAAVPADGRPVPGLPVERAPAPATDAFGKAVRGARRRPD